MAARYRAGRGRSTHRVRRRPEVDLHRVFAALVPAIAVACSLYHDIEQDDGFRGVRLGSTATEIRGIELHRDEGHGSAIYRPSEPVDDWGRAPISVFYHLHDERLWKIEIRTGSSKDLLPAITGRYGTPSYATPWQWEGETVRMNFKGTEYDSTAVVTIVKKPLEAERERERAVRKAAAEAAPPAPPPGDTDARAAAGDTDARAAAGDTDGS